MALRRDVSKALLAAWENETRFVEAVRRNLEAERMKKKGAEYVIVQYYLTTGTKERLLAKLDDWAHR